MALDAGGKYPPEKEAVLSYNLLANLVMLFHFAWIVWLLVGIRYVRKYKWYQPIHGGFIALTIVSQIIWLGCPLSTFECALRKQADPEQKCTSASFVVYYLHRIGIDVPPVAVTISLGVIAVVTMFIVLIPRLMKRRRDRRDAEHLARSD